LNSVRQSIVCVPTNPLRASDKRLDLFFRERQRRQKEARLQYVADPRLSIDIRAHGLQRHDVTTDGPQRNAELARKRQAGHRSAVTTKNLHQVK
jgi:hypothetical protein